MNESSEYTRKICPMCGARGKDLKEEDDKKKPLYRFESGSHMYSKKNICKKCGYEF